jgi:rubredoxin-NAD+ reductase
MSSAPFRQFICRACGLIYDEAKGDEDSGLAPGTRFDDIPQDWACPLCGVTKADFEPHEAVGRSLHTRIRLNPGPRLRARRLVRSSGLVIVGAGTAAWTLVERIRSRDARRPITMITACQGDRYDKPRLSVALRQGVRVPELVREPGGQAAARLNVELVTAAHATSADPKQRILRTTRGSFHYEELVLAHGCIPRECPGLPDALTWRVNDLRAYAGLRAALDGEPADKRHVLIVGAGLVGCELANDLALAGHRVSLLDAAERPLAMAQATQSQALLRAWQGLPIDFIGGMGVQGAHRIEAGRVELQLTDGRRLQGDLLVSAVGLRTPSRLARSLGLQWEEGIALDPQTLLSGVPHVHALGDCVSLNGRPQRYIEPIHRQAAVLTARLCGDEVPAYESTPPVVRVKTSSLPLTLTA